MQVHDPVRIGFDASPLLRPHPRGIQRVVGETLDALEARGRVEVVRLEPPPGISLRRWRQGVLPREVRALGLAGVHSFLSAFPLRGPGRRVQPIHELPWRHGVRENAGWRHRLWARLGPWRADAVVTATETVARELPTEMARDGGKAFVVPWGVKVLRATDEPLEGIAPRGPYVLAPGAVRAKKNLAALLCGLAYFAGCGGPELSVVVTGPPTRDLERGRELARRLGLSERLSTPGEVSEAQLAALYRGAAAVAVLSFSEGFGLPVLEALAAGSPVIVPAGSAQGEVAGAVGIAVDASSSADVARGLVVALGDGDEEDARRARIARAREFTWERTAEGIEGIWERWA